MEKIRRESAFSPYLEILQILSNPTSPSVTSLSLQNTCAKFHPSTSLRSISPPSSLLPRIDICTISIPNSLLKKSAICTISIPISFLKKSTLHVHISQIYSTPMDLNGLLNNRSFLNEPIYDLTLSQYQYNDSNSALPMYAESPLPTYVDCEERQLDEDNEDTLYARSTKKGQRADNFDNEEDKLLVSAWLNTSLDAVKGNDQKKSQFWKRITNYYAENKTWDKDRSEKSLISRWTKISSIVSRFCAIHSQIEHLRRSGYTEQDKIVEAKEVFRKEEGHSFQLDHCWFILRFQHKWMNEQKKIAEKKKSRTHSTKTPNSINLDDNNVEAPEPASLKRPIGRKAAKEMSKKAKTKERASENDNELSKVRLELEELRARRLESERIRAEQFQLLLANEQKHIELKEKKLEVQAQIEEDRVMAMDTSGMSQTRVEYFKRRRKEIFAKQGGMFENI